MDHHVPRAITEGLRLRGVDVVTTEEEGTQRLEDADLLDRATALSRPLFSQDRHLLAEAARRQRSGVPFAGVIYAQQEPNLLGKYIHDLEFLCLAGKPDDFENRVTYLPLRY
jgi:hypothetical protein